MSSSPIESESSFQPTPSPKRFSYDPFDPAILNDPYPAYAYMREHEPLYHNAKRGFWALSRFADVQAIGRNSKEFSTAANGVDLDDFGDLFGGGDFLETDPPLHDELRHIVRGRFTPTETAALAPLVEEHVEALISEVRHREDLDLAADFAWQLPLRTICDLLGAPRSDWPQLIAIAHDFETRTPNCDKLPAVARAAGARLWEYFGEILHTKRSAPDDDLTSLIAHATLHGQPLRENIQRGMCLLLFTAGLSTTASLISNSILLLEHQPAIRRTMINSPETLDRAVEELLRFESPIQGFVRTALVDVRLYDTLIAAGERLYLLYASANRDARVWDRPDVLDLRRPVKRHKAFGDGIHFCLGAHLARLEAKVAFRELFSAIDYEVVGTPQRVEMHNFRGLTSVPCRITSRRPR